MAMNYANLGFAQVDFTGVDYDSVEENQQLLAGTYAKTAEAIKSNKMLVIVNLVMVDEDVTIPISPIPASGYISPDEGNIYLNCAFGSGITISPDDKYSR